jgi:basic amino acid/polyamine antiporter, APA family
LGVILLGLWVLVTHPSAYTQHLPPNPPSIAATSSVSTLALFAMLGIECAMIPAGRVRDPARTIPRATLIGTVVTALIYIGVSVVPLLLIPQAVLAASNAPFAELFARVLGAHSGEVLAFFVVIGGLGALNGWTMMLGEVTQSISRHGSFPRVLSNENRHGAPTFALIVTGVIASIMLLSNYAHSIAGMFTLLSVIVTAGNLPFYFACCLAVILGARAFPGVSPQRARRLIAVAVCAATYCTWASIGIGIEPLLWALALAAAGAPVYWLCRYSGAVSPIAKPAPVTQGNSSDAA